MTGLHVESLSVRFGPVSAVKDVTLHLPVGQVMAVLGPSGSGKSTLLRAIAGIEPPCQGRVLFDEEDVGGIPTHRRGFALMFQDGQLFAHMSVERNVAYALRIRRVDARASRRRVDELLELVGLAGYNDRSPSTLSGGERQRVALARALAVRPRLLLLDEPLSALDAGLRARLAADLRDILTTSGTTAMFVTHDLDEAFAIADRMAVMRDGRLVQEGTVSAVATAPVDLSTARFLGYSSVLRGDAARSVWAALGWQPSPGDVLALRPSAMAVDPAGVLSGTVTGVHHGADIVRLRVAMDGVGEIDAVTSPHNPLAVGQAVRLTVDPGRLARVPAQAG